MKPPEFLIPEMKFTATAHAVLLANSSFRAIMVAGIDGRI
jgi:hypothetical protein